MSLAKLPRRVKVAFDSSRKVGKIWNVSASASFWREVAEKMSLGVDDQVAQLRPRPGSARRRPARSSRTRPLTGCALPVEHGQQVVGVVGEGGQVADRVVEVLPAAGHGLATGPAARTERSPRLGSKRLEDLVELDGLGHAARRPGTRRRARCPPGACAGRELDVGLAQQRLLAQDRPRVRRDGRELARRSRSSRSCGCRCAGSRSLSRTLPTLTPATRTSASRPSCVASGKATLNW